MYCSKCGYELEEGSNFCSNCGSSINNYGGYKEPVTVVKSINNEGDGLSILAIVLAIFLPLASFIMSLILKDKYDNNKIKNRFKVSLIISSIIIIINVISLLLWGISYDFGILGV